MGFDETCEGQTKGGQEHQAHQTSPPTKTGLLCLVERGGVKLQAHDHKEEENQYGARVD